MSERLLEPYKDVIKRIVVKQVLGVLMIKAPWLRIYFFRYVTEGVVELFVTMVLESTILGLNIAYMMTETAVDLHNFKKALADYDRLKKEGATNEELDKKQEEIIVIGNDLIDLNARRL